MPITITKFTLDEVKAALVEWMKSQFDQEISLYDIDIYVNESGKIEVTIIE